MCVVCGCGSDPGKKRKSGLPDGELKYTAAEVRRGVMRPGQGHPHPHGAQAAAQVDAATGDLHYGMGAASVSVPGMSQSRTIRLEQDVLAKNNHFAALNRAQFARRRILALNLVSSPGSGKTTLLCETIDALQRQGSDLPVGVIEGDQQASHDADRIRATGAPAIQINTGKGCHLDAQMVGNAFSRLPLHDGDERGGILFIENVGNLVCPAMWDLGEAAKVAILSVTEGEDKPLKYPDMFAAASLMILNKTDLLPYVRFDVERCIGYARRVNPKIQVLQLSATGGQGMDAWLQWISDARSRVAEQPQEAE